MPVITNFKRAIEVLIFAAKADNGINKALAKDELEAEFGATDSEANDAINLIVKMAFESAYVDTETWNKTRNFMIPLDGAPDGYSGQVRTFKRTLCSIIKSTPDYQVVRLEALKERKTNKRIELDDIRDEATLAIAIVNGQNVVMTDNIRDALTKGRKNFAQRIQELDVTLDEIDDQIAFWTAQI